MENFIAEQKPIYILATYKWIPALPSHRRWHREKKTNWNYMQMGILFYSFVSHFEIDLAIKWSRSLFRHFEHKHFFPSNNSSIHLLGGWAIATTWITSVAFDGFTPLTKFNDQMQLRRILWWREHPSCYNCVLIRIR